MIQNFQSQVFIWKKKRNTNLKYIYMPTMFIEALFPIAKVQKQPASTLIDERIKKIWCDTYISIHHTYTHTHTHTHT